MNRAMRDFSRTITNGQSLTQSELRPKPQTRKNLLVSDSDQRMRDTLEDCVIVGKQ